MSTRLSRFFESAIEAGWLAALIVTPLFFNVHSSRVFEPDKLSLLRSIALIMAAAWVGKVANAVVAAPATAEPRPSRWQQLRATPLALPTLVLVLAYLISTLLSVSPRISWWGSYQRLQGTYTTLSYIVIFALALGHLRRREQWLRVVYAVILASLPIAFYGIMQRVGADPLPWGGNVRTRIAANMGNSIFVAAYLLMVIPLTLERTLAHFGGLLREERRSGLADSVLAGCYLFILTLQMVAFLFTQSRGPFLGLLAGLYVFGLLGTLGLRAWASGRDALRPGLRQAARWSWLAVMGLAAGMLVFLVVFNLPRSPLAGLRANPYIGRLGTALDLEANTARVRTLIWQGATELIAPHPPLLYPPTADWATLQPPDDPTAMRPDPFNLLRPLVGYGPETMWVVFNPFYPPQLAYHEARNASPDRSHNETFDALVIGGILGFVAYMALFISLFYYSLKWLGLIRSGRQRLAFLLAVGVGGLLGALIPRLVMGNWILFGLGLPTGLIIGAILYITAAALWNERQGLAMRLDGRTALIITLLATVVAHFVEIHFGIAIAATRTYFWFWAAALVALGMGWLRLDPVAEEPWPAAARPADPAGKQERTGRAAKGGAKGAAAPAPAPAAPAPAPRRRWNEAAIWGTLLGIILFTLAYDFVVNPSLPELRSTNPLTVLWTSLTVRVVNDQAVVSLGILWMVLFTWAVGALVAASALSQEGQEPKPAGWSLRAGGVFSAVALGIFLAAGLIHAAGIAGDSRRQVQAARLPVEQQLELISSGIAGHVAVYYLLLFLIGLGLALLLWRSRPLPARWLGARRWLGLAAPALAFSLAIYVSVAVNLNLVQADIVYKVGQAYESARLYDRAAYLYRRAIDRQPREDYYYLFLGRALLEQAQRTDGATAQQLLEQAEQALLAAQALNPLNTDHSANLGRFYITKAQLVDPAEEMTWLQRSLDYYAVATTLSPNAAHLRNEYSTALLTAGDLEGALEQLQISQQLDPRYADTYRRLGTYYEAVGQIGQAVAALEQAVALAPRDVAAHSLLGYLYAQQGDLDKAIAQNLRVIELRPTEITGYRNLALLYQEKGDIPSALAYAQRALELTTNPTDKAALEAFIQQLRSQQGG
ncbi:MAG: tetratricopeptide repeat protein [Caldilineales bacterium]|nr:tetratricopeptide repeat protein [Caldilineales bacterium]MDW8316514.1 tetratricopeptide repeat protein [Anaerolineae bacterium]